MIKTSKFLFVFVAILSSWCMTAQEKTITGTVTSSTDGTTLPGVTIIDLTDPSKGALTDFDGKYTIEAAEGQSLQFSFVGMKTETVTVGSSSVIDVAMQDGGEQLDEIVVTALGIKRNEKTLTFAQQTVKGEDLTKTRDVSFVNSISGKVAGVEIRKSSSGAGGSTKVQIRGNKSLSGDSSPLFVIDGIPMVNNRGGQPSGWDGVDQGDGLSSINQDDIESMTVLKGANAAILYGSQGANGVIIITTKSGREGTATVQVNSGVTMESIIALPELQFNYGSVAGAKESWSYTKGDYASNYVDDWFQTGVNFLNSVSVSGGTEKTQAYFSYANTSSTGVTPKNSYLKNNFTFKQSTKLFDDKVKLTSNVILAQEKTSNRNRAGYYDNPLTGLYWFPRDRNFNDYKNNYSVFNPNRNVNEMNWFVADHHQSNPYWLLNEDTSDDRTNRAIVSVNAEWDIVEHLKLQMRGNFDYSAKSFDRQASGGGNTTTVPSNGRWQFQDYTDTSIYYDAILSYNNTFGDFELNALGGGTYQKNTFGDGVSVSTGQSENGLMFANEFYFQNLMPNVQVNTTINSRVEKQSLFANAELGYKEMLFLDVAGRNDWASTLALTGNDSYFYPSVGLTAIVSKMVELPDWITFGKLRGSWAQVGNEVPYNTIDPNHTIRVDGSVAFQTTKPFYDAKPEIISTFEIGLDWRFLAGRLGIDFTYYDITSVDQFIRISQPIEDYTSFFVNAGEITNKGVELTLTGKPVVTDNFTWSTAINYTNNTNEIVELHPDVALIGRDGTEGFQNRLVQGGTITDLYGFKFQRDDQGRIILDDGNGKPLRTADRVLLGDSDSDYVLGWGNSMNYKRWSLDFQINGKIGGVVGSQSEALYDGNGVSERSGQARDRGYENINAVQNGQPVSQIDPFVYYDAIGGRNGIDEAHLYDRTNWRLAQLAVSYSFNVETVNWLNNASLSFIGNNLFYFYKDAPFDPELTNSTGTTQAGIENYNLPATRTYGLNLSLTF